MRKERARAILSVLGGFVIACAALLVTAAPGSAAPAGGRHVTGSAAGVTSSANHGETAKPKLAGMPCGYAGYIEGGGSQPWYNHCGSTRVEIQVDHVFWGTTYFCAGPGEQAIPQGNNTWRIYSAEFDGKLC
jgi:hypothetical protein